MLKSFPLLHFIRPPYPPYSLALKGIPFKNIGPRKYESFCEALYNHIKGLISNHGGISRLTISDGGSLFFKCCCCYCCFLNCHFCKVYRGFCVLSLGLNFSVNMVLRFFVFLLFGVVLILLDVDNQLLVMWKVWTK